MNYEITVSINVPDELVDLVQLVSLYGRAISALEEENCYPETATAPKPEPLPEEAPFVAEPAEPPVAEPKTGFDRIVELVTQMQLAGRVGEVRQVWTKLGVIKGSELGEEQWPEAIRLLEAL